MAEKKKYNSILVSGRKDETLAYSRYIKDEETGESVKESLDKKVNVTDELETQQIKDGAITNEKMAADSVSNTNLQDGSVSNEKLEDGSITNDKLAENSITKDKLKDNTIGVEKLDPELRQTINAATGLPEDLVETIQNVDDTLKDHQTQLDDKQSQIDDKQLQITANDEDISLLQTRSTQMEETIKGIAATGGASQATAVTYDNENSKLTAVNIQSAVDEVVDKTAIKDEEGTLVETPFRYIQNEEFIFAKVDNEDKLLFGIQWDGTPKFGKTSAVEDRLQSQVTLLAERVATIMGDEDTTNVIDTMNELKKFFAEIENTQTLTGILANLDNVAKNLDKTTIKDEEGNVQDTPFRIIENEEFIKAIVDSKDKILFGFRRDTGKPYYPLNEMYHVGQNEEFFALWLDAANHVLLGIRRDGQIIGEIHAVNALKQVVSALREKIDTIDTSLKELLDIFSLQDNTEHLAMETDAEGRILSFTNPDGSHYIHNAKSETIPTEFEHIEDPEGRTEIIMDTEEKVLGYRDSNGILNEKVGINSSRYFLNGKEKDWAERGNIHFSDINDAISHNTTNLLITSEISKTFNDGKTTFSPPNAGYELSNRIECKAGDYFTRTGTATGLIVVTDKNDTNGMRLLNSDGSTLGSTFQIPNSLDWVRYIRMAVNKEEAIKGNIAICKGKYAFTGENKGDFYTIDSIRIQEKNLPNDVRYLKTSDGKYWELYIDETDLSVKAKEVDPSVIKDLPLDFPIFEIKGDFSEFGQRILFYCGKYMIVRNNNGVVAYKNTQNPGYSEFRRETAPNGDFRYVGISSKGNKFILEIFDDDFKIVNSYTGMCDPHDFVYFNDNHIAILEGKSVNVNIPNGNSVLSSNIYCSRIRELRFNGTSWSEIGSFNVEAYPQLLTDCCGITEGKTYECHHNTLFVDYDGNYIINLRNCNSFVKIKRVEINENEIIIGSKRQDYDEAIIGRVGGIYNSGYMDSKRIIPEGFSFNDTPVSLNSRSNDEQPLWMFYHQHDVAYWGKKKIDSKEYPTYTLFDNNTWTGNGSDNLYDDINQRNNYKNNPTANNTSSYHGGYSSDTYDSHTISRCVQISVDWENRLIKDFKVYQIKKRYSSTRGSAQMLDEGVILFNWADQNRCGLYDFNDPTTNVNGKLYENGKELFSCYTNILGTYRLHLYQK